MVALTGGPEGETLIRRAARIAARSPGGDLLAVHVTRSDGLTGADPAALAAQRRLVESLGGTYHQVVGDDIPEALLDFARAENATQLVLGASRRRLARRAAHRARASASRTIRGSGDIDVHIVTHAHGPRPGRCRSAARRRCTLRRQLAGLRCWRVVLAPLLTLAAGQPARPAQPDQRRARVPGRRSSRSRWSAASCPRVLAAVVGLAAAQLLLHPAASTR